MKMELLADKTKEEIATIWTQHFASKDAVCAIIPYDTFKKMKELYDIHKTVSMVFTRVFDVLRFNSEIGTKLSGSTFLPTLAGDP